MAASAGADVAPSPAFGTLSRAAGEGWCVIYISVNVILLRALGTEGLAATTTPASALMRLALGERGATLIALGIAISTLGFLSQSMLTAPRVYYAMAKDGLFFRSVATVHPATQVPTVAIALQGAVAIVIALSGTYEQILGYVVSTDFLFGGLTGLTLVIFRRRERASAGFRAPAHPITTLLFVAACWLVVLGTAVQSPKNTAIGWAILAAGLPAYWWWRRPARTA